MLPSLLYLVFLTFPYVSYQFTVSDLCDNERILDVYHYCPYASHYGLDAESCNMQCRKRSYACSAFIDTVICMCGDIPEDMVGNSYTCLLAQTEIWCTPEKGITVEIDATLGALIPALVGGEQRINLGYQVLPTEVTNRLNDMSLIMKIMPEALWETLGKPPPSEIDFISSVPQAQDIQFSLSYEKTKVALTSYKVEFNRTVPLERVSFTCPENVRKDAYFNCHLISESADGFDGKVTWGKQQTLEFHFPRKAFDYIGTENVYSGDDILYCSESGLIITGTQAMYSGDVQEVFIHLKAKTAMKIFILRATCDSGKVYDYLNDACQSTPFDGTPCNSNEVYTPIYRVCFSSTQNITKRNIKQDAPDTDTTVPYMIVKVLAVDASASGLQSFMFQRPFRVEVGDRIALLTDREDAIACTATISTSPADLVYNVQPGIDLTEGTRISGFTRLGRKRFKISAAIATPPNSMVFEGRFASTGAKQITATININSHAEIPLSKDLTRIVNVIGPLVTPDLSKKLFVRGKRELVRLTLDQESEVTYFWDFGDGTQVKTSKIAQICHTFAKIGQLTLTLNITTAFEEASHQYAIEIYEGVSLGSLRVETSSPLIPKTPIDVSVDVISGSDVAYAWFVNQSKETVTQIPATSITFGHAGSYQISVTASNAFSSAEATTTVQIIAPLSGLALKYDSIPIGAGSVLTFSYTDGIPTSGETSIDSGEWRPVSINPVEMVVHSEPMTFQAIGQHKVAIQLRSERDSMEKTFDFWVEKAPTHYYIESDTKKIPVNTPITLKSRIQCNGTGAVIEVFDEYGYIDTQNLGHNVLIPPQFIHHHPGFSNPAAYVFHGSLAIGPLNLSNVEIIYVMPTLGTYVLRVNQTQVAQNEELIAEIVRTGGFESPCLDVSINWDDGTQPTFLGYYQESTPIKHTYTMRGQYSIQAVVQQNSTTQSRLDVRVEVGDGISDFSCHVSPSSVLTTGEEFELIARFRSSQKVDITLIDAGSATPITDRASEPLWSHKIVQQTQGIWSYTITVANSLFSRKCDLTVETQTQVTGFTAYLEEENVRPPGDLILHLVYGGTAGARPNGIEVIVNWANETTTTIPMASTVNDLQLKHRMSKDGNFALAIIVQNNVSSQHITLPFSFFKPIILASVHTYVDQLNVAGYGVDNDYFTLDDSIRFESVSDCGTINSTYLVIKREHGDEDIIFSKLYTTNSTVYKISELGNFKVIANMSNTINYYVFVKTIHVAGLVRGMRLSLSTLNLASNVQGEIKLSFVGLADAACVCAVLGNGVLIAFPPVGGSKCDDCPSYTVLPRTIVKKSFTIPVLYSKSRVYTITASVGNTTASLNVLVSEQNCYLPFISLEASNIGSPNTPALIKVEDRLTIAARSNGTVCSAFQGMLFKWLLFKLDSQTTERISELNLPQVPSTANLKITLPPNLLMPGSYEVNLVGLLNNVVSYSGTSAYLIVSEMAPIIRFLENGEEMMSVSESITELCLSPIRHSYNPNLQNSRPGEGITDWHISCSRRVNTLTSAMTSCDLPSLPGMNAGDFCINRTLLNLTGSYFFKASARVGQLSGVGNLQVTFIPGDVSSLKISMVRPSLGMNGIWEGVTSVSKTTDLALEGRCEGNCVGNFLWTIEREDQYGSAIKLTLDELKLAAKNFDRKALVIQATFLMMFKNSYRITVCLLFTSDLNIESRACRRFNILDPPMMGNCEIDNAGEITKDTIVCISCEGTGSDKRPVLYRFQQQINSQYFTFVTTTVPTYCGKIPYVTEEFQLCVDVTDNMGSRNERCYFRLFFKGETPNNIYTELEAIAYGTDSDIANALRTADPNELAVTVQSVARLLVEGRKMTSAGHWDNFTDPVSAGKMRAEIAVQLVDAVSSIEVTDPNSLRQVTSTINALAFASSDIPRAGQEKLLAIIQNVAKNVRDVSKTASKDDSVTVGKMVLDSFFSIMTGTQSQINNPLPGDKITDLKEMDYDTSIETSELDVHYELDFFNALSDKETKNKQEALSANIYHQMMELQEEVYGTMSGMLAIGEGISTRTDAGAMSVRKLLKSDADRWLFDFFRNYSDSSIEFTRMDAIFNDDDDILIQATASDGKLYTFANKDSIVTPNTQTVGLQFYKDGEKVEVNNLPGAVTVNIAMNATLPPFTSGSPDNVPLTLPDPVRGIDGSLVYQHLVMTAFEINKENVGFSFQIRPDDNGTKSQYLVVARFIYPPALSSEERNWGIVGGIVPPSPDVYDDQSITAEQWEANFTYFIDNIRLTEMQKEALVHAKGKKLKLNETKTLYVGFRECSKEERTLDWEALSMSSQLPNQINTTITYRGFTTSCNFIKKDSKQWENRDCRVDRRSTSLRTVCICDHLTTFGAGWIVPPNKIDFDYVFRNIQFDRNATLYATEITIAVIFVFLFIWARRMDNKDIQKLGITPLAENNPADEYLYEVLVCTGMRKSAGTKSTVCMQLNGTKCGTPPCTLRDPHRKVLSRGNVDRFLLATHKPLGDLRFLRLWHDNRGRGDNASWYCDFVCVIDLQTKNRYNFIVEKWFGVDEGDGLVDRVIPVAGPLDRLRVFYIFSHKVKSDASDKHLWASIFTRPAHSRFTRVERVACCLLVLFLTMVSSCMFYKDEGSEVVDFEFTIGPFALTPYVAYTGAVTCLITFVPVTLVMLLFRNSKLRISHTTLLRGVVEDHLDEELEDDEFENTIRENGPQLHYSAEINKPPQSYSEAPELSDKKAVEKKKESLMSKLGDISFPWQMRILAWFLLIGGIAASVVFTTFYGISFGDAACKQWLSSLFVSFFMDLCLTQPIKVILFAIFFAVICRSKVDTSEIGEFAEEDNSLMDRLGRRYRLNYGEEYLHEEILRGRIESYVIRPPDQETLERARVHRQKTRQMFDILRELLFFIVFFTLLVIVSNGFRDPMAMRLRESLTSLFFNGDDFIKINSIDGIWNWLEEALLPNLRAGKWYNGVPPLGQRGFIGDRKNRIMGYATMRQVRVREDSCKVFDEMRPLFNDCYSQYHVWDQDESDYLPGWIPTTLNHDSLQLEYRYTKAAERDGYLVKGELGFYSGGGYVHELRGSITQLLEEAAKLREQGWIDHRTRAVIIEIATYNPGSHLFGITVIKFEVPGTGGVIPSFRIEPANLLSFSMSSVKAFELTCQILFVMALAGLLIKEMRNLWRKRLNYLKTYHAWAQLFIICSSFSAIAIYVYISTEVKKLTVEFYRSNGNGYANFQKVANWNEVLSYLVALITFVAILMFMHILRFNRNIGLLGSVLIYANRDMKYFFIVFALIFFSFVVTFYLLFYDTMTAYSTMISSMQTSFQIVLGKFDVKGMYEREPILGPMLFAGFSLFIIFIMLSMFVAILTDSFEIVRRDSTLQSHDHEMVDFMLSSFIIWSGLNRFKWGRQILDSFFMEVNEQMYKDDEEQEHENIIAEFNETANQFIGCIKRAYFVRASDF